MYTTNDEISSDGSILTCDAVTTGTTIMGVEYNQGVVIGADSRTTANTLVVNRVTDKLTRISDYIYCCRSGSCADTQAISDIVSFQLSLHQMELEIGTQPLVSIGAQLFKNICYKYRQTLLAGFIVAGWDCRYGGQVFSVPIGGMCRRTPVALGGSGSSFIYGYVDANYRPGMTKHQAMEFVSNSLSLAMGRDGSSGGVIRLASITKDGVERRLIPGNRLPTFWDR